MPNNRREPLSSLSLNKQNKGIIHHSYQPLSPCINHVARPVLSLENSKVTGLCIFKLFGDSEMVNVLVEGINVYTEEKGARGGCIGRGVTTSGQVGRTLGEVHSHQCRPWKKVTAAEILVFLALLIYMGARRRGLERKREQRSIPGHEPGKL